LRRLFIGKISVDIAGRRKRLPKRFLFQSPHTPHFIALSRVPLVFAGFIDNIPEKQRKYMAGDTIFAPIAALMRLYFGLLVYHICQIE
jgi:hypothetical protein